MFDPIRRRSLRWRQQQRPWQRMSASRPAPRAGRRR